MYGEEAETSVLQFIEQVTNRSDSPAAIIRSARAAIAELHLAKDIESPFGIRRLEKAIKTLITERTTRATAQAGTFDVALLIDRIRVRWPDDSTLTLTDLRAKAILLLGIARCARAACLAATKRLEQRPDDGSKLYVLEIGHKTDANREGTRSIVYSSGDVRACPVSTVRTYMQMTAQQAERWEAAHPDQLAPLFLSLRGSPDCLKAETISSIISSSLESLGFTVDSWGRKLTGHSVRRSARQAAQRAGFDDRVIDFVGKWKNDTSASRRYEDPTTPADWTARLFSAPPAPDGEADSVPATRAKRRRTETAAGDGGQPWKRARRPFSPPSE